MLPPEFAFPPLSLSLCFHFVDILQVVPLRSVHPKFLFGSGKAAEMSGVVSAANADTVFVNAPLSGAQQKGLAEKWEGATILDRFRVILDIFADRARTTEAKLQVPLLFALAG